MKNTQLALISSLLLTVASASHAASTTFSDRSAFYKSGGVYVIDNYENPSYKSVMTDAAMSAVLGETDYFTYGGNIVNYNNILPDFGVDGSNAYCSLCYGSFRLSFTSTSLTNVDGIYGIGIDITENGGAIFPYRYSALVTFADSSTASVGLPYVAARYPAIPSHEFWGITSIKNIRSIDFISYSSSGPDRTFLIIDNLTIMAAPVPEQSTLLLICLGLCAIGLTEARKRTTT